MAKVRYYAKENSTIGTHSFYAVPIPNGTLTFDELLDRNGNIIAGKKSQQAAIAAGIKKVRVIETTGDELVAVKRTDVEIDSAEGRKMAYLDKLTTQVNLTWDVRAPFTQGGGLRRGCGSLHDTFSS